MTNQAQCGDSAKTNVRGQLITILRANCSDMVYIAYPIDIFNIFGRIYDAGNVRVEVESIT